MNLRSKLQTEIELQFRKVARTLCARLAKIELCKRRIDGWRLKSLLTLLTETVQCRPLAGTNQGAPNRRDFVELTD